MQGIGNSIPGENGIYVENGFLGENSSHIEYAIPEKIHIVNGIPGKKTGSMQRIEFQDRMSFLQRMLLQEPNRM